MTRIIPLAFVALLAAACEPAPTGLTSTDFPALPEIGNPLGGSALGNPLADSIEDVCQITINVPYDGTVIAPKKNRPDLRDTPRLTVAVAEGYFKNDDPDGPDTAGDVALFGFAGDCGLDVKMEIDTVIINGGPFPTPPPFFGDNLREADFRVWPSTDSADKWFVTWEPNYPVFSGYFVTLNLLGPDNDVLAQDTFPAIWHPFLNVPTDCWLWYYPKWTHPFPEEQELDDSPACEVP